jgi:hypothetical protein
MKVSIGPGKNNGLTGYMHPAYAQSLAEFGTPRELPRSGGWVLEQEISDFSYKDAMGCYPLFACQDWSQLSADLEKIEDELIALSLVTDPFGEYTPVYLQQCFADIVIPFKAHFITDLHCLPSTFVSSHHRRYARKALRNLRVERCEQPRQFLDPWLNLYATLIERHDVKGIRAFSKSAFAQQLSLPGITAFRAVYKETTVGMLLWYMQNEVGYYHLGAYSPRGYELRASFALFWFAIEYFAANGLRWLNLGAGAGIGSNGSDGLTRFKRGWATGTRTAYFCGRIFDQARYDEIVKVKGISADDFFPVYRKGEFE